MLEGVNVSQANLFASISANMRAVRSFGYRHEPWIFGRTARKQEAKTFGTASSSRRMPAFVR